MLRHRDLGLICTIAVSVLAVVPTDVSALEPIGLARGIVGHLQIGMPLSKVESLVGRTVEVGFAGDQRAGLSFSETKELNMLGLAQLAEVPVIAADVFLVVSAESAKVEIVSLAVPCDSIGTLAAQLSSGEGALRWQGTSGWKNIDRRYKYVWGAETKPECRFWLRAG